MGAVSVQVSKTMIIVITIRVLLWLVPLAALSVVSMMPASAAVQGAMLWMAESLGFGVVATCCSNVLIYAMRLQYMRKALHALLHCSKLQLHNQTAVVTVGRSMRQTQRQGQPGNPRGTLFAISHRNRNVHATSGPRISEEPV